MIRQRIITWMSLYVLCVGTTRCRIQNIILMSTHFLALYMSFLEHWGRCILNMIIQSDRRTSAMWHRRQNVLFTAVGVHPLAMHALGVAHTPPCGQLISTEDMREERGHPQMDRCWDSLFCALRCSLCCSTQNRTERRLSTV